MKLMFMGTESFALEVLKNLYEYKDETFQLCVVTQTDKPRGRGHKMVWDCVKEFAVANQLPCYQPENLKRENFSHILEEENPRLIVVASYGKILPQYVLDFPQCGCVCVHASLLPKYRGAAPINRVIMNGETQSGVTLMYMDRGIDTGAMICNAATEIGTKNAGELREELAKLGANLLMENFNRLWKGICPSVAQNEEDSCYAEKITAQDRPLDFSRSANEIVCQIKGLAPAPCATCTVSASGLSLKVLDAEAMSLSPVPEGKIGEVIRVNGLKKNTVAVKCNDGVVILTCVQPDGSKPMDGASLLNGRKIQYSDQLL